MSFKQINQVKKSTVLPRTLKSVLEAYLFYANSDGTSIRPTQKKVGERAGLTRQAVNRHTQELVRWGLLVHDVDAHGQNQRFAYSAHGIWAFVYHADISRLDDPELIEYFESKKSDISRIRAEARNKTLQASVSPFVTKSDEHRVTPSDKHGVTTSDKHRVTGSYTDPTLCDPVPDDHSVIGITVKAGTKTTNASKGATPVRLAVGAAPVPSHQQEDLTSDELPDELSCWPLTDELSCWAYVLAEFVEDKTAIRFDSNNRDQLLDLLRNWEPKEVFTVMEDTFVNRAESVKLKWNKFIVFYRNYEMNRQESKAYRNTLIAQKVKPWGRAPRETDYEYVFSHGMWSQLENRVNELLSEAWYKQQGKTRPTKKSIIEIEEIPPDNAAPPTGEGTTELE